MQASVLGGEDWFAALIHDWRAILVRRRNRQPSLNHCGLQRTRDGRKMLDLAAHARKDVMFGLVRLSNFVHEWARIFELPFPQRVAHQGSKWNCALRRFRFELADRVVAIGALTNMQLAAMQIDILPA